MCLLSAACGGGSGSGGPPPSVGAAGGTISALGATLQVPAGAITSQVMVSFAAGSEVSFSGAQRVGDALKLGPDGTQFKTPATLTLAFAANRLPAGRSASEVVVLQRDDATGSVKVLVQQSSSANTVTVRTGSFSTFQAALIDLPIPQVAVLSSGSAVTATQALNQFTAFTPSVSLGPIAIPDAPGLENLLFAGELSGTVRVLSLAADGALSPLRSFTLESSLFAAGLSLSGLAIQDSATALAWRSGTASEAVYAFDPRAAASSSAVTKHDLSATTVSWPAGTLNSAGVDVGGSALQVTFPSGAVVSRGKLLVSSSNFDSSFNLNPGTVLRYDYDASTRAISNRSTIATSHFNPTGLARLATPQGELVLCTNTGKSTVGPGSVDVINAASGVVVARIDLAARNATGPVVISRDKRRGYLASQNKAEVYTLDLSGIGSVASNTSTQALPSRLLGTYQLPATSSFKFISGLALSHTGNFLYAVNFNESRLWVVDLIEGRIAASVLGFQRSGLPSNFEGQANGLALRAGQPGVDFTGPSLFVSTINLKAADRVLANVSVVIDSLSFNKH